MGGGAAAGISAVELLRTIDATSSLAIIGGIIGAVSFSGSIIAFMKLQGWMRPRPIAFTGQQVVNTAILVLAILSGAFIILHPGLAPI